MSKLVEDDVDIPAVAGIVLAAGLSRRMGRPKMALPWGDTTLIGQVVSTLARSDLAEICVVTGGDRLLVEQVVKEIKLTTPMEFAFNPQYEKDEMIISIQIGLASLSQRIEAAMIALGDQPQVELATIEAILEAARLQPASLIVPSYKLHRGHPWLVRRSLWAEILALKPPQNFRGFMNAHAEQIHYVNVESDSVLQDIDTPDDYQRYRN